MLHANQGLGSHEQHAGPAEKIGSLVGPGQDIV